MKKNYGSIGALAGMVAFLAAAVAGAVPVLSEFAVGNVSTTSFCVCWQTSESSNPGLDVFSDAAGTQSLAGQVQVELYPLSSDQRAVASTVASRDGGRSLRNGMKSKNVVLVRVSGLDPDTDYFARPLALDGTGATIATGDLQAVTTARTADFVNEARQVLVDLSALDLAGAPVKGGLVVIGSPAARYPLLAVVGDGTDATTAYADLSQFLDLAGARNLVPAGVLELAITWKGISDAPGAFVGNEVSFGTGPLVAESSQVVFDLVSDQRLNYFIYFRHLPPVVGLPQDLFLATLRESGGTEFNYNRPAILETSGSFLQGGGTTAPFVDGMLFRHKVVFGTPGIHTFTVRDSLGMSATTVPIEVLPLTYDNWRAYYFGSSANPDGDPDRDPDGDGLRNSGEFTTLQNPRERGAGVLDVTMTPGGLLAWLDFNRFQAEYVVRFETSLDLRVWQPSAILPSVRETLPTRDVIEAVFPPSEFGGADFGAVRAIFEPVP